MVWVKCCDGKTLINFAKVERICWNQKDSDASRCIQIFVGPQKELIYQTEIPDSGIRPGDQKWPDHIQEMGDEIISQILKKISGFEIVELKTFIPDYNSEHLPVTKKYR
jgi:hypothetical protein